MKFRRPPRPTRSEQKEIYHLAGSIISASDSVEAPQALVIAQRVLAGTVHGRTLPGGNLFSGVSGK
jgi:hypothetical protein